MARTLTQPLNARPAPRGARNPRLRRLAIVEQPVRRQAIQSLAATTRAGPLRQGYGLLIAAGASLGLWAGIARLVIFALG